MVRPGQSPVLIYTTESPDSCWDYADARRSQGPLAVCGHTEALPEGDKMTTALAWAGEGGSMGLSDACRNWTVGLFWIGRKAGAAQEASKMKAAAAG